MNGNCKFNIASGLVVGAGILAFHIGSSNAPVSLTGGAAEVRESMVQRQAPVSRSCEEVVVARGLRWDEGGEPSGVKTRPGARREAPPAIRLSDDFKLPAVLTGASTIAGTDKTQVSSPQIREVSGRLVTTFYQEIAGELARAGGWEDAVESDPESGEETAVVKPGNGMSRIRSTIDERYRALFGADAFNAATVASAKERMLPVPGQSSGD